MALSLFAKLDARTAPGVLTPWPRVGAFLFCGLFCGLAACSASDAPPTPGARAIPDASTELDVGAPGDSGVWPSELDAGSAPRIDGGPSPLDASTVGDAGQGMLGPLPSPWQQQDVGAVGVAGDGAYRHGVFVLRGAGTEIYHQTDQFHFAFVQLDGDGSIEARVVSVENTATYATAGVMFRSTLDPSSPAVMVRFALGQGIFWSARTTAGNRWNEPGGVEGRGGGLPIWVRLQRTGGDFTGASSSDGSTWTELPAVHVDGAPSAMLVGLALDSQRTDVTNTSVLDHVRITGPAGATVWEATPPIDDGTAYVPVPEAGAGPQCPVSGQPGDGADCARLCSCLQARCGGQSDDMQRCISEPSDFCKDFSAATCAADCAAFSVPSLCCRAGACTGTFHDPNQCAAAFTGAGCP